MDKQIALNVSQLCINGYKGVHGKLNWDNFTHSEFFNVDNNEGIFAIDKNGIAYCNITGSNEDKDWSFKKDGNFDTNLIKGALIIKDGYDFKLHEGFGLAWESLQDKIFGYIKKSIKIIFGGHSRGGSIARIGFYEAYKHFGAKVMGLYTEGEPRSGNTDWANAYKQLAPLTYRFVYKNDTVTRLPWWFGDWSHCSPAISLGKRSFGDGLLYVTGNIEDHYPQKYFEEIKKL